MLSIPLRWSDSMAVLLAGSVEAGRILPQAATERAEFLGEFRGVRYTAEHAYGYTFELWRVSGKPVGLWARVEGFPDTFLTVRVADLHLGRQGMVSFSATFCELKESFAGVPGRQEPERDGHPHGWKGRVRFQDGGFDQGREFGCRRLASSR